MSRNPRGLSESGIYHIMFRGSNKQQIFLNNWDYEELLKSLASLKAELEFEVFAYCLMTNHVHFVIKEKNLGEISIIMHRLLTKYARWFNLKYDRTGTLLEGRYRSQIVDNDEYFLHLIRYVHQNPLKAKLAESLTEYRWSSYNDYLTERNHLTDTAFLYGMMSREEFEGFHNQDEECDFTLFDNSKRSDFELLVSLKNLKIMSVEELKVLMITDPAKFHVVIDELKKQFSDRHIARVTGISRYKLNK